LQARSIAEGYPGFAPAVLRRCEKAPCAAASETTGTAAARDRLEITIRQKACAQPMSSEVESVTIPLVEEELRLGRETLQTGRVRVRTVPERRTEAVSQELRRTDVRVERVPRNEEVAQIPAVREEGDSLVVPVVEERLVKRLFLVEEVRLTRRASTEQVDQEIELRSQRVVVERHQTGGGQQP
jgi:stress response protein YsnF